MHTVIAIPVCARRASLLACALLALTALLAPALASAAQTHLFLSSFNGEEAPTPLQEPLALAVDGSSGPNRGDLYVVDRDRGHGHSLIDRFDSSGHYLSRIDGSETPQGSLGSSAGLAVDPLSGDLYLADKGNGLIDKFDPEGHLLKSFGAEGQLTAQGIAGGQLGSLPSGGTFTLAFEGQTTAPIGWNAGAAEVQSALLALSTIGAGNVTVSGPAGGPWQVEFTGVLAGLELAPIGADGSKVVGGAQTAEVTVTDPGGPTDERQEVSSEEDPIQPFDFFLSFEGKATPEIEWEASAAEIQTALEGLSTIGAGNVSVSSSRRAGLWQVEFIGALAGKAVPQIVAHDGAVVTLTQGGPHDAAQTVSLPAKGSPFVPVGLAVDPENSDLFLGDSANRVIDVFSPGGKYLRQFPVADLPVSLAFDSHGHLFVAGNAEAHVYEASSGALDPAYGSGSGLLDRAELSSLELTLDLASGDVYVAVNSRVIPGRVDQFDSAGNLLSSFDPGFGPAGIAAQGAPGPAQGDLYLSRDEQLGLAKSGVEVFGPRVTVAEAATQAPSQITPTEVILAGTVNPGGLELSECLFEYGETTAYGHTVHCEQSPNQIGSGESPVPVSARVALQPNTPLHYRLLAPNQNGPALGSADFEVPLPVLEADTVHEINGEGRITVFGTLSQPAAAGTNEVQEVVLAGNPTGGTFKLGFEGEQTGWEGTCQLTAGSVRVEHCQTTAGAGIVGGDKNASGSGDTITGPGIRPGTRVLGSRTESVPLELTKPATETRTSTLSAELPYNAPPFTVESALRLLPAVGEHREAANVSVAGSPGGPYAITFSGVLGDHQVPQLSADASGLTPSGSIDVSTLIPGHNDSRYHFEFITQAQFEAGEDWAAAISTPSVEASNGGFVEAQAPVLAPETEYRFRLVAESEALPGDLLRSQAKAIPKPHRMEPAPEHCSNEADRYGASAALPDCRAYEQVTPPEKEGAEDLFSYGAGAQARTVFSSDGDHFFLRALTRWGSSVSGVFNYYDFNRTPNGWAMTSLIPQPQSRNTEYEIPSLFFDEEISQFPLERFAGGVAGGNPASNSLVYESVLGPAGGPYTKLASEAGKLHENFSQLSENVWVGQSRDGSLVVLESADHGLIAGHPTQTIGTNTDLYGYYKGALHQLNLETGGGAIGSVGTCAATLVQGREGGERGAHAVGESGAPETGGINSISADGSRVFFYDSPGPCATRSEQVLTDGEVGPRVNLYVREPGAGTTYDIGAYTFEGADPQGNRLLLARPGAGGAVEYFTYDVGTHAAKPAFTSPESIAAPGSPVHVVSAAGNAIYFMTLARINREAPPAGEHLWRYDLDTEALTYVTDLTGSHQGNFNASPAASTDGQGFYFQKQIPPGGQIEQVFAYDASEQVVQCLACASPYDPEPRLSSTYTPTAGPSPTVLAPLVTPASASGDFAFFDTPAALVPKDVNGESEPSGLGRGAFSPSSDVYEWRRHGIDGCALRQGCLALITPGEGAGPNILLGTDPSGKDVFFATDTALVGQDRDDSSDIYDARIGGGFPPPPVPPVQCEGDACHNPPPAPAEPSLATASPKASGNEPPRASGHEPPVKAKPSAPHRKHRHRKLPKKRHRGRSYKRHAGSGHGGAR